MYQLRHCSVRVGGRGDKTDADPASMGCDEEGRWQTHPGPVLAAAPEAGRNALGAPGTGRGQGSSGHRHCHFSSTGYWSRSYTYLLMRSLEFFYNWRNRSSGRLGCFPEVRWPVHDKAGTQIQTDSCAPSFPLCLQHPLSFNQRRNMGTWECVQINPTYHP